MILKSRCRFRFYEDVSVNSFAGLLCVVASVMSGYYVFWFWCLEIMELIQVSINPNPTKEQLIHGVQHHFLSQVHCFSACSDHSHKHNHNPCIFLIRKLRCTCFLFVCYSNWMRCRLSSGLFEQRKDWKRSTRREVKNAYLYQTTTTTTTTTTKEVGESLKLIYGNWCVVFFLVLGQKLKCSLCYNSCNARSPCY